MATIKSIANKIACKGSTGANTGKLGCLSLFGTPTHLLALDRGTKIAPSDEFDLDYIKESIQKGIMIPIMDASAFEDVSAEDAYNTNTGGEKRLNLKGLPEYNLTFEEGHEFYRQLAKLETYKGLDFIIGDDEGNWMLAVDARGNYQGFTAGHVTPSLTRRKVKGGDNESKQLLIQFLNRRQFDLDYAILHADKLDFYPSDVNEVNGVYLDFTAIPADGDTSLAISVSLASDRTSIVEGLDDTGLWRVIIDGSVSTVTNITESTPGEYDLTVSALSTGEDITVDLYDSALKTNIVDSENVLYRAEELTAEVIA